MAARVVKISVVQRNLPFLKQQLSAALRSTSLVVKLICCIVIFCYILSFSESAIKVLSVTPGFLIPPNFWVWTAFTYCFLEIRLWLLLADVITVGFCGKLLEPLWGTVEMLTFFALVNTSVAFLTVMFYIIVFTITSDPQYLFSIHIHGLAGYCAGVAVAVKQIMPDHVLLATPIGKLKNKHVPLSVLILSLILWPTGLVTSTYPVMFSSGLLSSWVYLRFYQHHTNSTVGDMAESFSFSSFFPNVMRAPLSVVCNTVFGRMLYAKLCKRNKRRYDTASSIGSVSINLSGTDSHDAERRRQIALRALSERLNKVEQLSWPLSVDDQDLKSVEKSKHITVAMPPDIGHQYKPPPVDASKPASTISDEILISPVSSTSSSSS